MIETYLILERVNSFYSESFTHLLALTGAIFALFGIVLPILISIYQNRIFKVDQKNIESSIEEKLTKLFNEKIEEINLYYKNRELSLQEEIKTLEKKSRVLIDDVIGGVLLVQGNTFVKDRDYISGLHSYIKAAISYISANSEGNLKSILPAINEEFNHINKHDIGNDQDIILLANKLIKDLEKININSRYSSEIKSLNAAYIKAQTREA